MAIESVTADAGAGGASFATDTITGTVQVPYVKLMSGTDAAEDLIGGDATNGLDVDVTRVSGTVAVSNAGLTELAAAINASSQMDVNIAASAATVAISNAGITTIAGAVSGTEMQVDVVAALPAGTNAIGGIFPRPETSGGLTISRDIDLDNGTLTVVKNAAGQLYGWTITNTTTATVYVKFYDAASGTLGTGTPVLTIGIPGNASDDTTLAQSFGGMGVAFATGICVGAGTGVADADNTDPGANGVVANIYYK